VIANNQDDNREGEGDQEDHEEEDPKKAHCRNEEEKLRDVVSKLE